MGIKRGLYIAPFDELSDPRLLADLAVRAEAAGWDGFFLWDHIFYREPVRGLSDAGTALAAVAAATERVKLGALVTPLARRRAQKVARETVTLDRLSGGRVIFGTGLGSDLNGEFSAFGEEPDARARARALDEGLDRLSSFWAGEFEPPPLQQPRIPVWLAARWPNQRPIRRAAAWDGVFPIYLEGPGDVTQIRDFVARERAADAGPFDVVVANPPGEDTRPWEEAGASWHLTTFGNGPRLADVEREIEEGAQR
jgi:alkanesulfonate monooxygenase SsuD/methylene tetrahydromethanopterin reductase-like flavin-dependent oxidoreductase (luciferase family)